MKKTYIIPQVHQIKCCQYVYAMIPKMQLPKQSHGT